MTMNAFTDVIYYEILLYIPYEGKISFSMVDKCHCNLLLKRVRRIQINKKARLYYTSHEFRDKINSFIVDPYHQLSLRLFHPKALQNFDAFSCSELAGLDAQQLSTLLIPYLQKVCRLKISAGSSQHHLAQVIDWINSNPSLSLKELEFSRCSLTDFPWIDQVESLLFRSSTTLHNIPSHHITSNLRRVLFHACNNIEDVSSLDKIHELHLINCQGIRDISCLNHNYKIVIKECYQITNYSNSFSKTSIIYLFIVKEVSLDFSHLLEVKELEIFSSNKSISFIFPVIHSSLQNLYLFGIHTPFIIPAGNHIRQLTIICCAQFTTLLNCDRIYFVKLSNLNISTLEGLGSGNKIVEIISCPFIKDFSVLRTCDRIVIGDCSGLNDLNSLRGIKDLSVFSSHHIEDMEGVTNLTLFGNLPKLPYTFPKSVKRLNLPVLSNKMSEYPSFLANLPTHVNEIKIDSISLQGVEAFRAILHKIPQFSFEWYRKDINTTITVYFRRNKY